jgi:hypothetical protein
MSEPLALRKLIGRLLYVKTDNAVSMLAGIKERGAKARVALCSSVQGLAKAPVYDLSLCKPL